MQTPDTPVVRKKKTTKAPSSTTGTSPLPSTGYNYTDSPSAGMTGSGVYFDTTRGPIVNVDDVTKGYEFNPPLISTADRGSLPKSLYPGPDATSRGYLFQDPNVNIDDSVTGYNSDGTEMVEYLRLNKDTNKFGFRFLYNPSQVSMAVGYSPGVDIRTISNNIDSMYNPIVPQTGSNIVFELYLNRIEDLAHGDALSTDMYPRGMATQAQVDEIKARGTMADYEYLLLTLNSGMKLKSKYRGNTADIGWLLGGAVVLKLGKSMVYQGFIENVSINHVRFTPKMVPALSSVQISMARYVDLVPESSGSGRSEAQLSKADPKNR